MISNEVGQQLHDKATRGVSLSAEEREILAAWYARLDAEEGATLLRAQPPEDLEALREQVTATLAQISAVSQQIQVVNKENEVLRKEIVALHQRLAQKAS
jgi:hypothetical protein